MKEAYSVIVDALERIVPHEPSSLRYAVVDVALLLPKQFPSPCRADFVKLLDLLEVDWRNEFELDEQKRSAARARLSRIQQGDSMRVTYLLLKLKDSLEAELSEVG